MENQAMRDFVIKFGELNPDNQRYVVAIQQALAFAQSSLVATSETTAQPEPNPPGQ